MIEFLAANWLSIAAIVLFVLMHRGHGCGMHGSHGGQVGHQHTDQTRPADRGGPRLAG